MTAPTATTSSRFVTPASTAAAAAAYLGVVATIDPFTPTTVAGVEVGCPLHVLTGAFCPGCGSTRAVHELVHGDVVGSVANHPLVIPVAVLLAYLWVAWARHGRRPADLPAVVPRLLVLALVALTVVRNVPGLEWFVPPA